MTMVLAKPTRLFFAILFCIGMLPFAGCNKSPKRVPVSGTVTLDGKPLNGGKLCFNPDESKGNTLRIACTGRVQGGKFDLRTAGVNAAEDGPGVPLGWYKVTLLTDIPGQPPIEVNDVFTNPDKTPLSVEVVESPASGVYDFQMTK